MKVFILAVDALEYEFVKSRSFPSLKQKFYTKVVIPKSCMSIFENGRLSPFTPVVWASFFTGKLPEEHGVTREKFLNEKWEFSCWNNKFLNRLKRNRIVYNLYSFMLRHRILKEGFPEKLGFTKKEIIQESFVDLAEKPVIIRSPLKTSIKWKVEWKGSGLNEEKIIRSAMNVFERNRKETLEKIESDWDLFITYVKLLDYIGHLYWGKNEIIERYYGIVENFAREIQDKLSKETLMIIVSDHGMRLLKGTKHRGGEHSHHAYASFSHKVCIPQILKITDFYSIISNLLQQKSDDELIMKELKELGYI